MKKQVLPFVMFMIVLHAHAQWSNDPTVNTAVCTAPSIQLHPVMVADGTGGAIITWGDYRNQPDNNVYVQRLNKAGVIQWTANGVAVSVATTYKASVEIASDGLGGAFIVWNEQRNGTDAGVYAQYINSAGVPQWTTDGIAICDVTNDQGAPKIISDGSHGAIITWSDGRNGTNSDIYAQRINAMGAAQWTVNGVAICAAINHQEYPTITSDEAGGAIITWRDERNGNTDVYAQHVNATGVVKWTANGVAVGVAANSQLDQVLIPDGTGGAIISWQDRRNGTNDIYAQRLNAAGVIQWAANGIAICNAIHDQSTARLISDGAGGAIIVWDDYRNGNKRDVYAQRINAAGQEQWTNTGVPICVEKDDQLAPIIVTDGAGGAIIAWNDYRTETNYDVYAQKINGSGVTQWTINGVAIATAAKDQAGFFFLPMISDGAGGAIISWNDYRIDSQNSDIYAQNVKGNGLIGNPTVSVSDNILPAFANLYPNPGTGNFKVNTQTIADAIVVLDMLGKTVLEMKPATLTTELNLTDFTNGIYFLKIISNSQTSCIRLVKNK